MSLRNKTIAEALREGKQRLRSAGKDAYAVEAELLLEKAVGLNRTALFLRGEEPISAEAAMQYEGFLAERESGRPTQYILGTWEFMGGNHSGEAADRTTADDSGYRDGERLYSCQPVPLRAI